MDRVLITVLRISAVVMLLALPAVFLPREWMGAIHRWLGLGAMPGGAIVDYLARSLSFFYAMAGGLLWLVSTDLRRYRPVLLYMIVAGFAFAPVVLAIDLWAGMPPAWTAGEASMVLVLSLGLWWLLRRVDT